MNIFKKIIRLFKKPPQVRQNLYRHYTIENPVPHPGLIRDMASSVGMNRNISQEQLLEAHRTIQRCLESYECQISSGFRDAIIQLNRPVEMRKRIPVNKEIDPFEEEIWYEDENINNKTIENETHT